MPSFITREEVRRLVDEQDAQLVEVLPQDEYEWAHLPGAVHVPLKTFDVSALDRGRPAVAYCNNTECDMSPRAAWRLEQFGFDAYDFVAGKMDWLSYDLPYEGGGLLVSRAVDRDAARCRLDETVDQVGPRVPDGRPLVVVNDEQVVMGIVTRAALDRATGRDPVERHMRFGSTTVRPSEDVEGLLHRMDHAGADTVVVSCSDGRFVGLFTAARAAEALEQQAPQHEAGHDEAVHAGGREARP